MEARLAYGTIDVMYPGDLPAAMPNTAAAQQDELKKLLVRKECEYKELDINNQSRSVVSREMEDVSRWIETLRILQRGR